MKTHASVLVVFFSLFLPLPSFAQDSSYRRNLREENGQLIYQVNRRATHLYMISRDLYGDDKSWREIANANDLKAPYRLELGQSLRIQNPPQLSEAEGDQVLIKAWGELNRPDVVEGILQSRRPAPPVPTAAPVAVQNPRSEVLVETPVTPPPMRPAPVVATPPAPPSVAQEHPSTKSWGLLLGVIGLVTQLESHLEEEGTTTTVSTGVDWGVEARGHFAMNPSWRLLGLAAYEDFHARPAADGTEVENSHVGLAHFGAGLQFQASKSWGLALMAHYKEEPLIEVTTDGAKIEVVGLTQLTAGPRWVAFHRGHFETILGADFLYSFPFSKGSHHLKAGQGFEAFVEFEHHLKAGKFFYGLKYRQLQQDTDHAKDTQKILSATLGFGW